MSKIKKEKTVVDYKTLPMYENLPVLFYPEGITMKRRVTKEDEVEVRHPTTDELFLLKKVPKSFATPHDPVFYTKVYRHSSEMVKSMSVPAFNLFYFIIRSLTVNQIHIFISDTDFLNEYGYSASSKRLYYSAVAELIKSNIIAKKSGSSKCYWINPNIMFNGDRTKISCPANNFRYDMVNN